MRNTTRILCCCIATLFLFTACTTGGTNTEKNMPIEIVESTVDSEFTEISKSDYKVVVDKLNKLFTDLRSKNCYFQIQDGENTYETFLYNSNGECIAQGNDNSYTTVFRNNNTSVAYTDRLSIGSDIELLASIESTLNLYKDNKIIIEKFTGKDSEYEQYRIRVLGWDNVKSTYMGVNEEFATDMVSHMKETVKTDNFGIVYYIATGDNQELSILCNLAIDGEEFTSWILDGYMTLYDWKLDNKWYELNQPEDATDEEAEAIVTEAETLLTELISDVDSMLRKYATDNNIDLPSENEMTGEISDEVPNDTSDEAIENENSEPVENSEATEDNTSSTSESTESSSDTSESSSSVVEASQESN